MKIKFNAGDGLLLNKTLDLYYVNVCINYKCQNMMGLTCLDVNKRN